MVNVYFDNNRANKCIYHTVLTNQYYNITDNFNQLISSGITHPSVVLIVPCVSSLAPFSFGDFAWKSPFDSCPGEVHSITGVQVTVGNRNVLQYVIYYN
jgi:hypothetical protein